MEFNEYQNLAQRTSNTSRQIDKVINGVMGLNGEAGECIDIVKKHYFQEHTLDEYKLKDELSDVLWYVAETATGLGITLEEIAEYNILKLKKRFPDGFDADKSINRSEYNE